jgi:hypothetical protein
VGETCGYWRQGSMGTPWPRGLKAGLTALVWALDRAVGRRGGGGVETLAGAAQRSAVFSAQATLLGASLARYQGRTINSLARSVVSRARPSLPVEPLRKNAPVSLQSRRLTEPDQNLTRSPPPPPPPRGSRSFSTSTPRLLLRPMIPWAICTA